MNISRLLVPTTLCGVPCRAPGPPRSAVPALLGALLCWWGPVPVAPAAGEELHPARVLIQGMEREVSRELLENRDRIMADPRLLIPIIRDKVLMHFDSRILSKWPLGRHWKQADQKQRERFKKEFQLLLIRIYGKTILQNIDRKISYAPVHAGPDAKRVNLKSEVTLNDAEKLPILYRLRQAGDHWEIFDINVNGISLVNTHRRSFDEQIGRQGLDGLLDDLEQRNEQSFRELFKP